MAYSITQFENNLQNSLVALDNNFTTFGALVPIPCTVAGTNTLTLTQNGGGVVPTPTISAYTTNMLFQAIASGTNTGAVTAAVGSLAALPVYKDTISGPVQLSGNEIIISNAFSLRYDAALNAGNGGFHLTSSTQITNTQIEPTAIQINQQGTITNMLSGTVALTFTATPGWSSNDVTFTLTGLPPTVPAPGDFFMINPPSLPNAGVVYAGMCTAIGSLSSVASVATINVRLLNAASASLASNSGTYRWSAWRTVP